MGRPGTDFSEDVDRENDRGRASSSAASSATTSGVERTSFLNLGVNSRISVGDELNDFQLYQRFRLRMVQMFGSLASALYEFGADPRTGGLSREDFVKVVTARIGIFTREEAGQVFSHITNADPCELGQGGCLTYRDMGISDAEWRTVSEQKSCKSHPFASGPKGMSMGVYHRPITVDSASLPSRRDAAGLGETSATSSPPTAGTDSAGTAQTGHPVVGALGDQRLPSRGCPGTAPTRGKHGSRRRTHPWQAPAKPWTPSIFAGPQEESEAFSSIVSRTPRRKRGESPQSGTASSLESPTVFTGCPSRINPARFYYRPRHSLLGDVQRHSKDAGISVWKSPPARVEMGPSMCTSQIDAWWPYRGRRPLRNLKKKPKVTASLAGGVTACQSMMKPVLSRR